MAKHVNSSSFNRTIKPMATIKTTATRTSGNLAGNGLYKSNAIYGECRFGDRYITTISFKPNSSSSRLYLR